MCDLYLEVKPACGDGTVVAHICTVAYKRQAAANLHRSLTDKYSLQPATVIIIIIIILYIS